MIAISRLEDYRHDVFDVVSGSVLGCVVTVGNWARYFPSLWAEDCDEPFEPAGRRGGGGGMKRGRDEEEGGYGAVDGGRYSMAEGEGFGRSAR